MTETTKNSIGAYPFDQVQEIKWSNDKTQAIVQTKLNYFLYDLNSDEATKFKEGLDVAVWSSRGDKIIYKYFDKNTYERTMNVADPNGEKLEEDPRRPFLSLWIFRSTPSSGEIFLLSRTGQPRSGESLMRWAFNGQNQRKVITGKYGADFLWSPDGKKLLTSFVADKGGKKIDLASEQC